MVQVSKFLSLVLRHKPEIIHLNMDSNGWVDIEELVNNANQYKNMRLTKEVIREIVATNDKQRYMIDGENNKIRANQGHSIAIDLALTPQLPPDKLYHGTATRFIDSIMKNGIKSQARQYVHLSSTAEIAEKVGRRHGEPIVLCINSKAMSKKGSRFYLSENKVWLVDYVPSEYITNLPEPDKQALNAKLFSTLAISDILPSVNWYHEQYGT